ncbi:MAG: membrane dipeptidase, partial [Phycisphaerae bacterium]|nr:membrane dipeptidase [Phycisphaerae bacterium]
EGADPLRTPEDVNDWFDLGLRVVGMAWKRTRAAGGTGEPGGLTDFGRRLAGQFDRLGIVHDASHLAEQAFWELLEATERPVIASHSNCRAIVPTDRQLSDDMIRAIASRGGVIGINFYDRFLLPPSEAGTRRAVLADVVRHFRHVCDITGSAAHVGLGTDMDGGLGREQIPLEIASSADLPRVGNALADAGFSDVDIAGILGGNWLNFFCRHLGKPV